MTANLDNALALVTSVTLDPDVVAPMTWDVRESEGAIVAANAYHVVDVKGLYDAYKPFTIRWSEGDDILAFAVDVTEENVAARGTLEAYIGGVLIDRVLNDHFE